MSCHLDFFVPRILEKGNTLRSGENEERTSLAKVRCLTLAATYPAVDLDKVRVGRSVGVPRQPIFHLGGVPLVQIAAACLTELRKGMLGVFLGGA